MTSSGEGSQSISLDDSNKPVEQCGWSVDCLQFAIISWWIIQSILFINYLFTDTYKATPVIWDYNRRRLIIGFYYSLHRNINMNLITVDQPGFEPGSLVPKAATLPFCYAPVTKGSMLKFCQKSGLSQSQFFFTKNVEMCNFRSGRGLW